jgi:hypothetical protein
LEWDNFKEQFGHIVFASELNAALNIFTALLRGSSTEAERSGANTSCAAIHQSYIHTYHSRFIPEGVAEVSQIFLQDTHFYQN